MKLGGKVMSAEHKHTHIHADGTVHTHDHDHAQAHGHTHDHDHTHGHTHDHAHGHGHTHSDEHKKAVLNRMSRIIGHMESVKRMVENDRDCSEVLVQLSAVNSALQSTGRVILKEHLSTCIVEAVQEGDFEAIEELKDAIDKFMK